LYDVGNAQLSPLGTLAALMSVAALVATMGINAYSAMLSMVTVIDCFHPVRRTARLRVLTILALAVVWCGVGLYLSTDALTALQNALILMLYLLVPWTAINLVDYFLLRRGRYEITDVFDPNGMYGRWSAHGLISYFIAVASMTPFMVLLGSPSPYTGFLAARLGHVDYSAVVGLLVAGGLYFVLRRAATATQTSTVNPETQEEPAAERR
jgi:nucleobase:cation symporter-1, NCS1 family